MFNARQQRGTEISIEGRIVPIAEVLDALSFARVYHPHGRMKPLFGTLKRYRDHNSIRNWSPYSSKTICNFPNCGVQFFKPRAEYLPQCSRYRPLGGAGAA
ncbi:MAG: hypothetical protein ACYC3A_07440 [Halothiobacillus sp.]